MLDMAKKRFRTCNLEESQNKRSNGSSQPSQSNNSSQPSQPNNPSQLNAPSGTSQSSHSIGSPQMDWPNRTSQPSRSNASLQLNRPNETSQPSRSNGSSQPSWSHPSSHAPSHVPHPQPQESEVNPQFEDDLDEDWLREEEMQRTDESTKRNTRGITRMVEVWNLTPEERIMLTFNKDLQAVSTEGGIFSRFIGTIARKPHLCPIKYKNWHEVPDQYKEDCWNIIESKFAIPQDERRDMIRHRTLKSMGEKWRNWKCSLKAKYYDETKTAAQIVAIAPLTVNREHYADLVAYWFSKEGQELSATNKESRREQTSAHTGGSKTYAQHAYDMEQKDKIALDRAKLYIPLHKRKDGTPVNEAAATKIEKLEALMSSQPSSSEGNVGGRISWSPNDIYSQVMGKEHHGRVRGLGFGPTPSKHGFMCNNFDHLRMVSDEERMRDKDTIIELKEQLKTQGDQLQTQGIQLQAQDAIINSLKEQVAFLMSQRHSSSGLQATDGCSGIPDQTSPRTHQRSSFRSHEMQPSNRASNKATMQKGEPIDDLFHSYANSPEGIEALCSDLGVDHTDVRILMLAWKMNAQKQGYFTQDEWQRGLKALTVETVNKLKNTHSWNYKMSLTEDKQKWIDVECICELLDIVMGSQFPSQVALFTKYLKIQNDYKVIYMDQWTSFLQFCSQISFPDLKNYDTTEAWPLILDDFVEWMREEKLATAES
ncbi:unnamed protein product [Camellia sinensis]